jgi:hypothetical protein
MSSQYSLCHAACHAPIRAAVTLAISSHDAIEEANIMPGADIITISLPNPSTITLMSG